MRGKLLFLLCLLCLLSRPAVSFADEERTMTEQDWQRLTNDKAFGYKNDKEKTQAPKEYKEGTFSKFVRYFIEFLGSGSGKLLAWLLAIFIVGYIVYKSLAGTGSILFGKRKRKMEEAAAEDDEDMASANWDDLMHRAAASGDIRLAVRYSYMRLLQLLQQHDLIQYRNGKTNYEYYTELAETGYKQPFRQLSRQYEFTWYGHYDLPPAVYDEYMTLYNNLKTQLGA